MTRRLAILLTLLLTLAFPAVAQFGQGQKLVTLDLKQVPLDAGLRLLFENADVPYVISPKLEGNKVPLNLSVKEVPFPNALLRIQQAAEVAGYPIRVEISGVGVHRVVPDEGPQGIGGSRRGLGGSPTPPNPVLEKVPVKYLTPNEIIEQVRAGGGVGGLAVFQPLPRESALLAQGTVEQMNALKQRLRMIDVPAKTLQITVGIRGPGAGGGQIALRSTARGLVGEAVMVDERATVGGHAAQLKVGMKTHIQGTGELQVTSDWDISVPVAGGPRGPVRLVKRLTTTTRLRPGEEASVAEVDLAGWGGKGILRLWIRGTWR